MQNKGNSVTPFRGVLARVVGIPIMLAMAAIVEVLSTLSLAEADAAASWAQVPSPTINQVNNVLNAVSCTASSFCVTVGYSASSIYDVTSQTLVETWDGTSWSVTPSPDPSEGDDLQGVSCVSTTMCVAVGWQVTASGEYLPLIETWDGTRWSVVPSADPSEEGQLLAVSCASTTTCTAVGLTGAETLAETWDGAAWSSSPALSPATASNALESVSCLSMPGRGRAGTAADRASCIAVGYADSGDPQNIAEQWDGTTWSLMQGFVENETEGLYGVSCPSVSWCTAVGLAMSLEPPPADPALWATDIATWNGVDWSPTLSPITPALQPPQYQDVEQLEGASCVSQDDCVAVGFTWETQETAVIDGWDGTAWSLEADPSPGPGAYLYGVSCIAQVGCMAVGGTGTYGDSQPLIESDLTAAPPAPLPEAPVLALLPLAAFAAVGLALRHARRWNP